MTTIPINFKHYLEDLLLSSLRQIAPDAIGLAFTVERPKMAIHGDYSTNLAMLLAPFLQKPPHSVAAEIIKTLPLSEWIETVHIAGPGFMNFILNPNARQRIVREVLEAGPHFGKVNVGKGQKIQLEFVSANPTGPLHVGHGRGAAYGASLSQLFSFCGFDVEREYYVNDAGRQMDILALSVWLRYLESHGIAVSFPAKAYQGNYVRDMAAEVTISHGDGYVRPLAEVEPALSSLSAGKVLDEEAHLDSMIANAKSKLGAGWEYIHDLALTEQLNDCRNDLSEFGVEFDCWFSEKSLFETGLVERLINQLEARGHVYTQDGAKWFRSMAFGDEKDRVLRRENGTYTYFASDLAYHLNKFERGFDKVINIWGADHHGYVARIKGGIAALGIDPERLDIALVQFANLVRQGEVISMSTRSASFVTLRELRREVGNDAARLFYVLRSADQHLDFDVDLAQSKSNDNPVYYIQYAHARICRVLESWGGCQKDLLDTNLSVLNTSHEIQLLRDLADFPSVVEGAATSYAPHALAFYLKNIASNFHSYYNVSRFLSDDENLTYARLALITAVKQVLINGFNILGISAPTKM